MLNWDKYFSNQKRKSVSKLLTSAINFCESKNYALDLGAGTLVESCYLLDIGFKEIVSVDLSPEVEKLATKIDDARFTFKLSSFKDFEFPISKFNLINARYSLPFNGSSTLDTLVSHIIHSLANGGIFVGQFFGPEDSWALTKHNLTFTSKAQILTYFKKLEILYFEEENEIGPTVSGEVKNWHVFHFIVKKPN